MVMILCALVSILEFRVRSRASLELELIACGIARTHLSLNKDCPRPRCVQFPSAGNIIAFPEVGGLHHRYERCAA
jgi:hypothetical protein